jgi:hypothetical protein
MEILEFLRPSRLADMMVNMTMTTVTTTRITFFQQSITALQFVLLMDMGDVLQTTGNLKVTFI